MERFFHRAGACVFKTTLNFLSIDEFFQLESSLVTLNFRLGGCEKMILTRIGDIALNQIFYAVEIRSLTNHQLTLLGPRSVFWTHPLYFFSQIRQKIASHLCVSTGPDSALLYDILQSGYCLCISH